MTNSFNEIDIIGRALVAQIKLAHDLKKRVDELEAENAKLREALEATAAVLKIAANDCIEPTYLHPATKRYTTTRRKTRTHCIDAMRACWAALGKWPP